MQFSRSSTLLRTFAQLLLLGVIGSAAPGGPALTAEPKQTASEDGSWESVASRLPPQLVRPIREASERVDKDRKEHNPAQLAQDLDTLASVEVRDGVLYLADVAAQEALQL